jgi:hypothetical protein
MYRYVAGKNAAECDDAIMTDAWRWFPRIAEFLPCTVPAKTPVLVLVPVLVPVIGPTYNNMNNVNRVFAPLRKKARASTSYSSTSTVLIADSTTNSTPCSGGRPSGTNY